MNPSRKTSEDGKSPLHAMVWIAAFVLGASLLFGQGTTVVGGGGGTTPVAQDVATQTELDAATNTVVSTGGGNVYTNRSQTYNTGTTQTLHALQARSAQFGTNTFPAIGAGSMMETWGSGVNASEYVSVNMPYSGGSTNYIGFYPGRSGDVNGGAIFFHRSMKRLRLASTRDNQTGGFSELGCITSNGWVGIGVPVPTMALEVNGSATVSNKLFVTAGATSNNVFTCINTATGEGSWQASSAGTPLAFSMPLTTVSGNSNTIVFGHLVVPSGKTATFAYTQSLLQSGSDPGSNQVVRIYDSTADATLLVTNGNWVGTITATNLTRLVIQFENNSTTNINANAGVFGNLQ